MYCRISSFVLPPPVLASGGTPRGNPEKYPTSVVFSGSLHFVRDDGGGGDARGCWVIMLHPLPPSLRAVADGVAIQLYTNLSFRPCERPEAARQSRKISIPRCFFLGRFTSFAMTGRGEWRGIIPVRFNAFAMTEWGDAWVTFLGRFTAFAMTEEG